MTLQLHPIHLNFLKHEENFLFFFISVYCITYVHKTIPNFLRLQSSPVEEFVANICICEAPIPIPRPSTKLTYLLWSFVHSVLSMPGPHNLVVHRETREGWPLLTPEANGNPWSICTYGRGPSFVGLLGSSALHAGTRYFCPALAALP